MVLNELYGLNDPHCMQNATHLLMSILLIGCWSIGTVCIIYTPVYIYSIMRKYGDRSQVFEGQAERTKGGLSKDDLIQNKRGKIVSKKRAEISAKIFNEYKQKKVSSLDA